MTPADSRESILAAAENLFASRGFAATTIKAIGREAGVNTALLYYYFDSKETLYREMLLRNFSALAEGGASRLDRAMTPDQAIRAVIAFQVAFLNARPHLPRIIARELADHEGSHAAALISETVAHLFRRICDVIGQGQRDGTFRRELKPEFAAISTIAQVVYLFIARSAVGRLLGSEEPNLSPRTIEEFADHAAEFALDALRNPLHSAPGGRHDTASS